jgi:predicted deacylase
MLILLKKMPFPHAPGRISGNTNTVTNYTATSITDTFIPITIVNGIKEEPTVLVLSGIHGSEYIPILTSQQPAKNLNHP